MASEFRLPDVGEGLTEAEIVRWLVTVGEEIAIDQPLVEVETAKSVVELPSPYAGVVLHLGAPERAVLAVGEVVAVVGKPGESWSADLPPVAPAEPLTPVAPMARVAPIVGSLSDEAQELAPVAVASVPVTRKVRAGPLVRKLARELGVDLESVEGTGPQGRVTREDLNAAAGRVAAAEQVVVPSHPARRSPAGAASAANGDRAPSQPADVHRPLSAVRKAIAANLSRAWSQIPMVSAFDDIDVGRLLSARKVLAERYGKPLPLDAMLVAAVLPVLRALPEFNSSLDGDTLVLHRRHDIGLAVDTPNGLLVAVIADASAKSLVDLADEVVRLGRGARERTLGAAELSGQTFTVSNIGAVGAGGHGTPLVPPGTTAIVSMGRAADKPVVRAGRIEVAPMMPVSLSYDHRVIDGAMGRRFLSMLSDHLAEPSLLLV